jgi:hypothetical protein
MNSVPPAVVEPAECIVFRHVRLVYLRLTGYRLVREGGHRPWTVHPRWPVLNVRRVLGFLIPLVPDNLLSWQPFCDSTFSLGGPASPRRVESPLPPSQISPKGHDYVRVDDTYLDLFRFPGNRGTYIFGCFLGIFWEISTPFGVSRYSPLLLWRYWP